MLLPSLVRLSLSGDEEPEETEDLEKAREAFDKAVAHERVAIGKLEKAQEAIKSLPGVVSMHRNLSRSLYERAPQLQKKYADDSQKELDAARIAVPGLEAEVKEAKREVKRALDHLKVLDLKGAEELERAKALLEQTRTIDKAKKQRYWHMPGSRWP